MRRALLVLAALLVLMSLHAPRSRAGFESASTTCGTSTLNFGASPNGPAQASLVVTGIPGIKSTSHVTTRVSLATATAEHSTDEHLVETLRVSAGAIVAGTGFTLYGEVMTGSTYGNFTVEWEIN